jgi:hypothetical protein
LQNIVDNDIGDQSGKNSFYKNLGLNNQFNETMYTSGDLHVVTNSHSNADMNNGNTDANNGTTDQGTSPNGAVRRVCISKNIDEATHVQQNAS